MWGIIEGWRHSAYALTGSVLVPTECCVRCCAFFFFQAEDGIRDLTVTGVQTCALPILCIRGFESVHKHKLVREQQHLGVFLPGTERFGRRLRRTAEILLRVPFASVFGRSEERRVGKECRSRWSPYH